MIDLKIRELIIGYLIASSLGVLFHFAYDFIGIDFLKIIFPSNESIFEHIKLIVFPSIIYMIIDLIITKNKKNVFPAYVGGIIVGSVFMVAAYYTYSGIIGFDNSIVNIIIYFISMLIVFIYRYKKITLFEGANSVIAFVILIILIELFSFYPADINLFFDKS